MTHYNKRNFLFLTGSAVALARAGVAGSAKAQTSQADALQAFEDMLPGNLMNNPLNNVYYLWGPGSSSQTVAADAEVGGHAFQVAVATKPTNPWDVGVTVPVDKGVNQGDNVLLSFWARSLGGPGKIYAGLGMTDAPWTNCAEREVNLTQDWHLYYVRGTAGQTLPDSKVRVGFSFGYQQQVVEIGQVFTENFGTRFRLDQLPNGFE